MKTRTIDLASSAEIQWKFQPEDGPWSPIQVPAGGWRAQGFGCDAGMYLVSFMIPAQAKGRRVRIEFEAVNFGVAIFVGPEESHMVKVASHVGGWIPFGIDVTEIVEPGKRCYLRLEVRGREKFKRGEKYLVPIAAPWFDGLAEGILRGVRLELVPLVAIENVFVRTFVEEKRVEVYATLRNTWNQRVEVDVPVRFSSATKKPFAYPKCQAARITLEPKETREFLVAQAAWTLGPESYWWPNIPYRKGYQAILHRVSVQVVEKKQTVHEVDERFGFREFRTVGNTYQLNGVRCNLRGDNQQEANFGTDAYAVAPGFLPPSKKCAGWPGAVDNLQRLNFNVLRIHQVPGTRYMLDVCDEMGLMIVHETPIRGSEQVADHIAGRECCIQTVHDLVMRDRQHPCIVIWSAANELFWSNTPDKDACARFARTLQAVVNERDGTRPVIFDGMEDIGPDILNMQHYVGGCGLFPQGGHPRADRPYGETESIWPVDNCAMGFAWMGTSTRTRRIKDNADIRNYVLNNAWPNYVPEQSRINQGLERKIKKIEWPQAAVVPKEIMPDIAHPWKHPNIRLMQQSFHPVPVWDLEFDAINQYSDHEGNWPVTEPALPAGASISRSLVVFNDELSGEEITVEWEVRGQGVKLSGKNELRIPCGENRMTTAQFLVPTTVNRFQFIVRTRKNGRLCFEEEKMFFRVLSVPKARK